MNSDDSQTNYALQVIESLKSRRFRFHEEIEPHGKKYTFFVSDINESDEEAGDSFIRQVEDNIQSLQVKTEEPLQNILEQSNSSTARYVPKNLIKNFICAFSNWTRDSLYELQCKQAIGLLPLDSIRPLDRIRTHLKSILRAKKYNTTMLQHLLSLKDYRALFRQFLVNNAKEWIKRGRMSQKSIYNETTLYLQTYVDGQSKSKLKFRYKH